MRLIPGGTFTMGAEGWYPEEAPQRRVRLDDFWIDETPVTNRSFARFVAATGHVTTAELAPDPRDYPGLLPGMDLPGSLVFRKPAGPVPMDDVTAWWHFVFAADWRRPWGTGEDIDTLGLWDHPVVHVSWNDAAAYARWAGKDLPTEAEHEYAARGGLDGMDFAWGGELAPNGAMLANYWQGHFPFANTAEDGWERTSPVRAFPANGHGLFDMIGNVWEWTRDWWQDRHALRRKRHAGACCTIPNPRGGTLKGSRDPNFPSVRFGRKVLKGGSHLCAPNYCQRYRPAARHPETIETSTSHIGFRCVIR